MIFMTMIKMKTTMIWLSWQWLKWYDGPPQFLTQTMPWILPPSRNRSFFKNFVFNCDSQVRWWTRWFLLYAWLQCNLSQKSEDDWSKREETILSPFIKGGRTVPWLQNKQANSCLTPGPLHHHDHHDLFVTSHFLILPPLQLAYLPHIFEMQTCFFRSMD